MTDQAVTLDDVEVTLARSKIDGALLVYIDTQEDTGRIRVNLNEGTLYDDDPEEPVVSADPLSDDVKDAVESYNTSGDPIRETLRLVELYKDAGREQREDLKEMIEVGLGCPPRKERKMRMDDVMRKAAEAFPESEVDQDADGQIIINTNLTEGKSGEVVSMTKPDLNRDVANDIIRNFRIALNNEGVRPLQIDKANEALNNYIADHYELF